MDHLEARQSATGYCAVSYRRARGHLDECTRCGHRVISYNSCRNRHCPKCQTGARDDGWKASPGTSSHALRACGLYATPSAGLLGFAEQEGRLRSLVSHQCRNASRSRPRPETFSGAEIASLACCTPGVRNSNFIHMCIAWCRAGGLSADRTRWIKSRYDFCLPVKVLSRVPDPSIAGRVLHSGRRES